MRAEVKCFCFAKTDTDVLSSCADIIYVIFLLCGDCTPVNKLEDFMKSIDYTAYSELIKDLIRDTTKSKSTKISNKLSGVNANLRTHFIDTIEKN